MGLFVIKPVVKIFAWLVASVLVYLNVKMVMGEAVNFFATSESMIGKISIIISGLLFAALLVYSIIFPLVTKGKKAVSIQMHPDVSGLIDLEAPVYKKIAVALLQLSHELHFFINLRQNNTHNLFPVLVQRPILLMVRVECLATNRLPNPL